jgi:hypothetical protein
MKQVGGMKLFKMIIDRQHKNFNSDECIKEGTASKG